MTTATKKISLTKQLEYVWHPVGQLPGGGERVGIFLWNSVGWTESQNVMSQKFAKGYKAQTRLFINNVV